jgi:hypothetical protein
MTTLLGLVFVAVLLGMIALSVHRVMPHGAVQIARVGAGAALVVAAAAALVTKQVAIALGLVGIALALLRPLIGAWRASPSPGATSEVRTDALAMTLDHDSGAMDGEVLAGRFAGSWLSELSAEDLQALLDEVEGDEDEAPARPRTVSAFAARWRLTDRQGRLSPK